MDNKEMREKFEVWAKENYTLMNIHCSQKEKMFELYEDQYNFVEVGFAYRVFKKLKEEVVTEKPKPIWTWEDKNNKILPETGSLIVGKTTKIVYEVVKKNNDGFAIASTNEEGDITVGFYTKEEIVTCFEPLETPQQKYDRERREFVLSIKVPAYVWKDSVSDFKAGLSIAYDKLKPFQEDKKTQE